MLRRKITRYYESVYKANLTIWVIKNQGKNLSCDQQDEYGLVRSGNKERVGFAWQPEGREDAKTLEGMIHLRNEKVNNEIVVSRVKRGTQQG